MIRHAHLRAALTILPLPVAVIESPFRAPLVTAVGAASLSEPGFRAASKAAIALSTITVLTDPEHRVTSAAAANPLTENYFAVNRHAHSRAGLDKLHSYVAL